MSTKHAVPAVSAVSALAGAAVAVPAAMAGTVAPAIPAGHMVRAVLDTEVVRQMPQPRPLVTRLVHAAARKSYTIVSGDTLSGIAGRFCGAAGKWPSLWAGNKAEVKDPDLIYPGQTLRMTCHELAAALTDAQRPASPAPAAAPPRDPFDGHHGNCGDGDKDGFDAPCSVIFPGQQSGPAPQQRHSFSRASAAVTGASGTVSTAGMGSFQSCVIARESGGDSQVMNASGHYGLYQFDLGTWESGGGSAADFGHASVAEQNQVFASVYAARGAEPWAPSDGC